MPFEQVTFPSLRDISKSQWDQLARKRIYFGHQSVGVNIIDGVRDLVRDNPQIRLNIVETHSPADFDVPVFAHSTIGINADTDSKIDAFITYLTGGLGECVDIALLKLCYVDITESTNVATVFAKYKQALSFLKAEYKNTVFVHVTTPHTSIKQGIKASIKRMLGRPVRGYEDNIRRYEFNELLRREYSLGEPVFDLAMREVIGPDGRRHTREKKGIRFDVLLSAYTDDGGHLNNVGRRLAAEQLLIVLADVAAHDTTTGCDFHTHRIHKGVKYI